MVSEDRDEPAGMPANANVPNDPERAYRCGYAEGWADGMNRLRELMLNDMLGRQAAYDACWSYWHRELFEWYDGFRQALTADNPLTAPDPEQPEVSHRRGYRDGWIEAIDAMWDLMFANKMTREPAYARCREHWEKVLCAWRDGDCSQMVIPPPLERRRT